MAYTIQCSQTLSPEGAAVRIKVFVEEQGFQNEFDRWDENGCAWHVLVRDGETPIAAGRMYSEAEGEYTLGRIAVIPAYRGKHIGKLLVSALEKQAKTCGASRFSLSAQCDKSGFYQKLGYALTEDYHMDEFCDHGQITKVRTSKKDTAWVWIFEPVRCLLYSALDTVNRLCYNVSYRMIEREEKTCKRIGPVL